jgi:hypothetical protein
VAILLFGLWWPFFKPTSYTVNRSDLSGVVYYTDLVTEDTHHEFYAHYGHGDVVVIVGIGNEFAATSVRAEVLLSEMLETGEYPNATTKRFSNAIVVCGVPDDCSDITRRVESNAREREAKSRAPSQNP